MIPRFLLSLSWSCHLHWWSPGEKKNWTLIRVQSILLKISAWLLTIAGSEFRQVWYSHVHSKESGWIPNKSWCGQWWKQTHQTSSEEEWSEVLQKRYKTGKKLDQPAMYILHFMLIFFCHFVKIENSKTQKKTIYVMKNSVHTSKSNINGKIRNLSIALLMNIYITRHYKIKYKNYINSTNKYKKHSKRKLL